MHLSLRASRNKFTRPHSKRARKGFCYTCNDHRLTISRPSRNSRNDPQRDEQAIQRTKHDLPNAAKPGNASFLRGWVYEGGHRSFQSDCGVCVKTLFMNFAIFESIST